MRVGVIGLGSIGQNHARVLDELGGLGAVCDWNRMALARYSFTKRYLDWHDMLVQASLDAVVVAVPTALHHEIGMAVICEGIPVLIEKPLANSVTDAEDLVRVAHERGVFLATGHIERFNPAIIALKERWGQLGTVREIGFERLGPFPQRVCDTGVAYDLATHDFDLLRHLTGQIVVSLRGEAVMKDDRDVSVVGIARLSDGVIVSFRESWTTPTKIRKVTAWGSRGMFVADLLRQSLTFYANDYAFVEWREMESFFGVSEGDVTRYKIEKQEPLRFELQAFLDQVEQGSGECPTGRDGLEAVKLAELMRETAT